MTAGELRIPEGATPLEVRLAVLRLPYSEQLTIVQELHRQSEAAGDREAILDAARPLSWATRILWEEFGQAPDERWTCYRKLAEEPAWVKPWTKVFFDALGVIGEDRAREAYLQPHGGAGRDTPPVPEGHATRRFSPHTGKTDPPPDDGSGRIIDTVKRSIR